MKITDSQHPIQSKTLPTIVITLSINIVVLFFLLFFGLTPIEQQRSRLFELAKLQAESRSRTAAITMETALRGIDASLQSIGQRIIDTNSGGQELTSLLATLTESLGPLVRGIFIVDEQGYISAQSMGMRPNERIFVGDRKYFSAHVEDSSHHLFIDQPLVSRHSGEWILLLSRAVRKDDGDLISVVVVSLEPQRIKELLSGDITNTLQSSIGLLGNSIISEFSDTFQIYLIQGDNRIVTKQPYDETVIGTVYSPPSMEDVNRNNYPEFPIYSNNFLGPLADLTIEVVHFPMGDLEVWYQYRNNITVILLLAFTAMVVISTLVVNWIRSRELYASQLQKGIKEREALVREISHRTKNSLAIVAAMVQLKAETFPKNDYVQQLAVETESRVTAMAQVYNHLDLSIVQGSIEFHDYIEDLIELMTTAYEDPTKTIQIKTTLDPITISLDHAVPLSIVLHELLTNIFKHAFFRRDKGKIEIALKQVADRIFLEIQDDGVGSEKVHSDPIPSDKRKNEESIGVSIVTQIIESQLKGKIEISSPIHGGYKVSFSFPYTQAPFIHHLTGT